MYDTEVTSTRHELDFKFVISIMTIGGIFRDKYIALPLLTAKNLLFLSEWRLRDKPIQYCLKEMYVD